MPMHALRSLLAAMITKLEVDMETREVVLELALPSADAMCLDDSFARKYGHEAHTDFGLKLAIFRCEGIRKMHQPPCSMDIEVGDGGDTFTNLNGPIAKALFANASNMLAEPPSIEKTEVLGAKISKEVQAG
jgi:hypothetical protein